jgi:predicted ArsR family transcriptional regulator
MMQRDGDVRSVAALGEPVRRDLYRYVVGRRTPVSRDEAAAGLGIARHVAKFHLDRLVADGLLDTEYRRPPGRTGPGAGRPSKLYLRARRDIAVSLPQRRYDLAGMVLAEAASTARTGVAMDTALRSAATGLGRSLAAASDAGADVAEVLAEYGYEPQVQPDRTILLNCPFHQLAQDYTEVVCGLNLDLIRGLLRGRKVSDVRARLDPGPDRCCVVLTAPGS